MQSKLKYQMIAYSEIMGEADGDSENKICIRHKNLKKYILCVFKLALTTSSEIILDYPLDDLAQKTADKCLEFAGVTDRAKGFVTLEQVHQFVEQSSPMAVFSKPE